MSEKKIVTVNLCGGLGNQLFKIASAYAYSKRVNAELKLLKITESGSGYTGSRPVYWDTLLLKTAPYLVNYIDISEFNRWYEDYPTMYKEISPIPDVCKGQYLDAYLQCSKYFYDKNTKNEIKDMFTPDNFLTELVRDKYKYFFENKDRVVVVHARRTDYLAFKEFHNPLSGEYYRKASEEMISRIGDPIFLLCSDDNNYWEEIKDDISETIFSCENRILKEDDILTYTLLQQFNNFIMSNSTFIWWCVWLSEAKNVIAPNGWFGPYGPKLYDDIYEPNWTRI